jgi:hypothetical protein
MDLSVGTGAEAPMNFLGRPFQLKTNLAEVYAE